MLVRFFLREHPPVEADETLLFRIIRGSFHMRRKQLANTLEESLGLGREGIERLCRAAGIDSRRRGETLTLEEFAKLARAAERRAAHPGGDRACATIGRASDFYGPWATDSSLLGARVVPAALAGRPVR